VANTTGTYTVGLKDERGIDLGRMLIEQAYVTGVASYLSPAYLGPIAEKSNYAFKSGATTYNLDDIYVRNAYWQEGNLLTWGDNSYGQIGDGAGGFPSTYVYSPVQTSAGYLMWRRGSAGYLHSSAIESDGSLWSWGLGWYGQLGDNTQTDKSRPVQIGTATTWWQVDCGGFFSAFLKNDGTLWTTGNNDFGQLGRNNTIQVSSPVQVGTDTTWRQIACGFSAMAAIKSDNSLWVWGSNYQGNLGTNNRTNYSSPVQTVTAGTTWKQVSVGGRNADPGPHMAAIKTDGTLWCWGPNGYGQLGDNTTTSRSSPVQTVAGGSNWKWVSCGFAHTAAIKRDGTLWCWGLGDSGQIGDNTTTRRSSPVQTISGGTTWREVSGGGNTTYGIKTDGTLWAWGYNAFGQGGFDLGGIAKSSPTQTLIGGTAWRGVDGGYGHVLAFSYTEGQFGVPIPPPAPSV